MKIPLSTIILTKNEVDNIVPCLQALSCVDEIIIVDSGSADGTLVVAEAARPDVRIYRHPFLDFGDQRNWALDNTTPKHEWVLFVDADEYCDSSLLDEIEAFISNPRGGVGGFVAGRNFFLGRWLRYSTMYPSYQLRLLKKGFVRFRKEGHGQREIVSGPVHFLRHGWRHEAFSKGVHQWVERHNLYATEEAHRLLATRFDPLNLGDLWRGVVLRRRLLRALAARLPFRPIFRFLYAYIVCRGFLDGFPGFRYCVLLFSYHLIISSKIAEIKYLERGRRKE